jgi:hypothetical protein
MRGEHTDLQTDRKLNILLKYGTAQNYRILNWVVQYFLNITSKYRSIAMPKTFVKQNNNSNKTCGHVHYHLLSQTSLV